MSNSKFFFVTLLYKFSYFFLGDEYDDADEGYRNKHSKYSKQRENSKNEKKGRLIIRNLSFKVI